MSDRKKPALAIRDCRYGYRLSEDRQRFVVDPPTAKVVKEIFSLYLSGTRECKIAKLMEERGVVTPLEYKKSLHGTKPPCRSSWRTETVTNILTTPLYTGKCKKNQTKTPMEITAEPLVDQEEYDRVQAMLSLKKTEERLLRPVVDADTGRAPRYKDGRFLLNNGTAISEGNLMDEVLAQLRSEQADAETAMRMFQSSKAQEEQRIGPLRKAAAELFEEMYVAMERKDEAEIIRCDGLFYELTREEKSVRELFSPRNPWVQLYSKATAPDGLTKERVQKWIRQIQLKEDAGRVTVRVLFKKSEYKDQLPQEWFQNSRR